MHSTAATWEKKTTKKQNPKTPKQTNPKPNSYDSGGIWAGKTPATLSQTFTTACPTIRSV